MDVGPGDPGMRDVAANRDGQAGDAAFAALDRQRVQQRLGWMFVRAVAGVDDRGIDDLRQQVRRAGLVVPDHQQVALHRVQGGGGVDQGLALAYRGGGDGHVDHVGAEALAGEFEAGAGAGAVLEEQVDQGASAQQVALGLAGPVEQHVAVGEVEQLADRGRFQPFDRQEMFLPVEHGASLQQHVRGVNRGDIIRTLLSDEAFAAGPAKIGLTKPIGTGLSGVDLGTEPIR